MHELKLPFYLKSTVILLGLTLLVNGISYGQGIIIPLAYSAILAILLDPLVCRLQRWKVPRVIGIIISILLALFVITALSYFIISQFISFKDEIPELKVKILQSLTRFQSWLEMTYGISAKKQISWLNSVVSNAGTMVGQTFYMLLETLALITLIPVYVFLFLIYKDLLITFLKQVFQQNETNHVNEILTQSKVVIQSYITGLLIEAVIVAVLNVGALLFIGIPYAILFGVIGAILNIVPYIGGIIAIALPVVMALVTKDGLSYPLSVVGAYAVIQFIDNNLISPRIVASKVRINALLSIVTVLIGGSISGIAGMFLAVPVVAILKIIFDRIQSLKPYGLLLGDEFHDDVKFKKLLMGLGNVRKRINRRGSTGTSTSNKDASSSI